jgi:adenosylcobinamide kinase/adenosylcobinamide-phosphate guanylyltransferase
MRILVSGGCKNGKSLYAQRLAKDMAEHRPLYYIATMIPHDREDDARIARHLRERAGWGFETVEQGRDLCAVLTRTDPNGVYLLDSLTALTANEMFRDDGKVDHAAGARVSDDLRRFLSAAENVVLVSDYLYGDAALYDPLTEEYRAALALCDRTAAACCDCVLEVSAAQVTVHKGALEQ